MHQHTKLRIPASKTIEDNYAPDLMPVLETRSEVKITLTQGWYATLHHPKMHVHNKFGIPTSNYIANMLRTQKF